MSPIYNYRKVSQERVIGVSFVDILIQAVFVLLIALMVGYVDPVERLNIEKYQQVGKDLCHKLNIDSPEPCREYFKNLPIPDGGKFSGVGDKICVRLRAKNAEECEDIVRQALPPGGAQALPPGGSQSPCLETQSQNNTQKSTEWEIRSPDEVVFLGFTPMYESYLISHNDKLRLARVGDLKKRTPLYLKPSEIESTFGFIREESCFHSYALHRTGAYSDNDIKEALGALWQLRNFMRASDFVANKSYK